jgi:predicted GTPase
MDLPESEENIPILRARFPSVTVIPISADKGEGINDLIKQLSDWLTAAETNNASSVESAEARVSD